MSQEKYSQAAISMAEYYGQDIKSVTGGIHPRVQALAEWMVDNVKPVDVDNFVKDVRARFEYFPKVSELEKIKKGNPEVMAERAWSLLHGRSSAVNVIIHDPYAFQVVQSYGSWSEFCEHREKDQYWCHKNFIDKYVMFMESGVKVQPHVLKGTLAVLHGDGGKIQTIEIGSPQPVLVADRPSEKITGMIAELVQSKKVV